MALWKLRQECHESIGDPRDKEYRTSYKDLGIEFEADSLDDACDWVLLHSNEWGIEYKNVLVEPSGEYRRLLHQVTFKKWLSKALDEAPVKVETTPDGEATPYIEVDLIQYPYRLKVTPTSHSLIAEDGTTDTLNASEHPMLGDLPASFKATDLRYVPRPKKLTKRQRGLFDS